jgi:hypothetical protein
MDGSKAEQNLDMKIQQVNDVKLEGSIKPMRYSSLNYEGNYWVSVLMITEHFILFYTFV